MGAAAPVDRGAAGNDVLLDRWSPLDFKRRMRDNALSPHAFLAPTWVGDHRRRLEAYKILAAYLSNSSRYYLNAFDPITQEFDWKAVENRREYGDPSLLVDAIVAALLGDDISIVIPGVDRENQDDAPDPAVVAIEDWAQQWADNEHLVRKLYALEEKAVGLGDGVVALSWDATKQRPVVTSYDPSFFFPVLEDVHEEFPRKVHIAWEFVDAERKLWVRRLTWELVPLDEPRLYPWSNGVPSYVTCLYTDAVFDNAVLQGSYLVDDWEAAAVTYETSAEGEALHEVDLNLDFIPVVHVPNTTADDEFYGASSIALVLQIIDDIQAADTDLEGGAALAGFPPITTEGVVNTLDGQPIQTYGPGTVFTGKLGTVDLSPGMASLLNYVDSLFKRMLTNMRLPEAAVGRVSASQVASGILLRLTFGPLDSMISKMRLIRRERYPLVFKFGYRIALANGVAPPLPAAGRLDTYPTFVLGSFLPSDRAATILEVTQLLTAHAISYETAVQMLIEVGVPIDDAEAEVERIREENFAAAVQLAQALGDANPVYEYLGLPVPDNVANPPPPPVVRVGADGKPLPDTPPEGPPPGTGV